MFIGIFGLCDSVDIYRKTKTVSYGHTETSYTLVFASYRCRKTTKQGASLKHLDAGKDAENQFLFLGEYDSRVTEDLYIKDSAGTYFEIINLESRRDQFGNFHHMRMLAEKI